MTKIYQTKQQIPIFIGSTFDDLQEYRAAVREALHRLETIVRGMEYFGSKPGSPKVECLNAVRSCKVYIGIFAMRYGSIDDESGKSMTHLEYEEANQLGLPILIYLLDEEKQPVLPKHVDTGDSAKLLQVLKGELKKKYTVSFFTTPEDLAKRVSQDIPSILELISLANNKQPFVNEKRNYEVEHQGKTYVIPLKYIEVLVNNDKIYHWCSPLKYPDGRPLRQDNFYKVAKSIRGYFKKYIVLEQLDELIKEGSIFVKGNLNQ